METEWIIFCGVTFVLSIAAIIVSIIAEVNIVAHSNDFQKSITNIKSANGFFGIVNNQTLELSTNVNGIMKGLSPQMIEATNQDITSTILTNFISLVGLIDANDTILSAFGKLNGSVTVAVMVMESNGFGAASGPNLTLTITVNGLLRGNGTAIQLAADTDVTGQTLTGYVEGAGTITVADSILTAINKLQGNITQLATRSYCTVSSIAGGTTSFSAATPRLATISGMAIITQSGDFSLVSNGSNTQVLRYDGANTKTFKVVMKISIGLLNLTTTINFWPQFGTVVAPAAVMTNMRSQTSSVTGVLTGNRWSTIDQTTEDIFVMASTNNVQLAGQSSALAVIAHTVVQYIITQI